MSGVTSWLVFLILVFTISSSSIAFPAVADPVLHHPTENNTTTTLRDLPVTTEEQAGTSQLPEGLTGELKFSGSEADLNVTMDDMQVYYGNDSMIDVAAVNGTNGTENGGLLEEMNMTGTEMNPSGTGYGGNESDASNKGLSDHKMVRDLAKVRRLEMIKTTILNQTGRWPSNPTAMDFTRELLPDFFKLLKPFPSLEDYTEKVQSFHPVCAQPLTDPQQPATQPASPVVEQAAAAAAAAAAEGMSLFFNLSYPNALDGNTVQVVAAKLKLYKFSQPKDEISCEGKQGAQNDSQAQAQCESARRVAEALAMDSAAHTLQAAAAAANSAAAAVALPVAREPYVADDDRIRVSVYYLVLGQKKNKVRRKLLDTKMVPTTGEQWVSLNVRAAARLWRNPRRNLGLVVEVQNEEGKPLRAADFFRDMNCSHEANASVKRPVIPSFLVDVARQRIRHKNASLFYGAEFYPVVDLCTMDVPKSDKKPSTPLQPATPNSYLTHGFQVGPVRVEGSSFHGLERAPASGEATNILLVPYHKLTELAGSRQNETPSVAEEEDEETAAAGKVPRSSVEPPTSTRTPPPAQHREDQQEPPEQRQVLEEPPVVLESQHQEPHPHRHHRTHHERTHSHEETSEGEDSASVPDSHEDYEGDSSSPWQRRHHQEARHRLHKSMQHFGHRHHQEEAEWEEKPQHIIVVPASELLALSEKFERAARHSQQQWRGLRTARQHHRHHQRHELER